MNTFISGIGQSGAPSGHPCHGADTLMRCGEGDRYCGGVTCHQGRGHTLAPAPGHWYFTYPVFSIQPTFASVCARFVLISLFIHIQVYGEMGSGNALRLLHWAATLIWLLFIFYFFVSDDSQYLHYELLYSDNKTICNHHCVQMFVCLRSKLHWYCMRRQQNFFERILNWRFSHFYPQYFMLRSIK